MHHATGPGRLLPPSCPPPTECDRDQGVGQRRIPAVRPNLELPDPRDQRCGHHRMGSLVLLLHSLALPRVSGAHGRRCRCAFELPGLASRASYLPACPGGARGAGPVIAGSGYPRGLCLGSTPQQAGCATHSPAPARLPLAGARAPAAAAPATPTAASPWTACPMAAAAQTFARRSRSVSSLGI